MTESLSVVIPAWNATAYLREAVESVRAEAPEAQIIVVDDGSTDGTAELDLPGTVRLTQAHAGVAAARNLGVAHASGTLLAFCDADDLWPPGRLAILRAALSPDRVVLGHLEEFTSPELPPGTRTARPGPIPGWVCGTMLLHRAHFDRIGQFDVSLAVGDHVAWLSKAREIGALMVPEVVLRRRIHNSNFSATQRNNYVALARALLRQRP